MKHVLFLVMAAWLAGCQLGSGDCSDGRTNGHETDVDCGGGTCQPCATDAVCLLDGDCAGGQCVLNRCAGPSCVDGVRNGDETDIDCGGACRACGGDDAGQPSCTDGVRNGAESDIDCGGECTPCLPGRGCFDDDDCEAGRCLDARCETELPTGCGPPLLDCNQQCVDPTFDRLNCGGCGVTCSGDQLCAGGQCTNVCLGGTAPCGSACFDFASDPQHCGACTNACNQGELCLGGQCTLPCPPNQQSCNGRCVSVDRDAEHCGLCGRACAPGSGCVAGQCVTGCAPPLTLCHAGTLCVDTRNDPLHCGGCDQGCPAPLAVQRLCSNSVCTPGECFPGFVDCNMDPQDGCEAQPMGSDGLNCGQCGRMCVGAQSCNGGLCCNSTLPSGSYQSTCINCEACEGVLTCLCQDQTMALQPASIPLTPTCPSGVFNCNGVLQCTAC